MSGAGEIEGRALHDTITRNAIKDRKIRKTRGGYGGVVKLSRPCSRGHGM